MLQRIAATLVAILILAGMAEAAPPDPVKAKAQLDRLAQEYHVAILDFYPIWATYFGEAAYNDKLVIEFSSSERRKRTTAYQKMWRQILAIDRAALTGPDLTSYDVLRDQLDLRIERERFPTYLLPISHDRCTPVLLAKFGSGGAEQPMKTPADYDAYLKRISVLPAWIDQAIANMREGMKKGIVQPKAIIDSTLPQLEKIAANFEANPYYLPVQKFPDDFTAADRERFLKSYRAAVEKKIIPATRKLLQFFVKEYQPAGRETAGWGALPGGAEWYAFLIRDNTTTTLDAERIHQIGLQEVARIRAELAKVAPKLGYTGEASGFAAWLENDPRFRPFKTEEEVIARYRKIDERVRAQLPRVFGRMPKAPLDIRNEPEITRATASAHYSSPAKDGSRPGIFWPVIKDVPTYSTPGMTSLTLHEGQPGHHFHLSLQQEMDLPPFRRNLWITAFGEGWALYAETLGFEMGLYEDPEALAGHLIAEMVRAVRLVVDTGLHHKGWTREQVMAYIRENQGSGASAAKVAAERYMASPAQALAGC